MLVTAQHVNLGIGAASDRALRSWLHLTSDGGVLCNILQHVHQKHFGVELQRSSSMKSETNSSKSNNIRKIVIQYFHSWEIK